jgi:probable F420-dependent oxidoreductase
MRFGLAVPHYDFSIPGGGPITIDDALVHARRAEALGFDSVWVSDHLLYSFARYGAGPAPLGSLEALTTLAAIATVTERVRLGTLVLCTPFRPAGQLAKQAATLDRISGGRVDLGLGAGWLEAEFDAFGVPFGTLGERFELLEETTEVLARWFADPGPQTFDGRHVRLREAPLTPAPAQAPIPLWLGGKGGPRLLRLAARWAAGWNVVWRVEPDAYRARLTAVDEACEQTGRDPATLRRSIGLYGVAGVDDASARAAFERGRAAFPGGAMDAETWDSWCADTLSGDAGRLAERVAAFEDLGVEEIVLSPWVLPFSVIEPEQLELFAAGLGLAGT